MKAGGDPGEEVKPIGDKQEEYTSL